MREWKIQHKTAGLENAVMENAAENCRGWKCRTIKSGKRTAWNAVCQIIIWH